MKPTNTAVVAMALLLSLAASSSAMSAPLLLRAAATAEGAAIYVGEDLFTAYKIDAQQKYPYFFPVNGPKSLRSVTTESSEPYPHHHSLFFGCDRVNGGNYWQNDNSEGQILSGKLSVTRESGEGVALANECLWRKPGEEPVMRDERLFEFAAPSADQRIIDVRIALTPLTDIRIDKTNHSLFAARMAPKLSVVAGGALMNASGDLGEANTFGKESPWCVCRGERDGVVEGLAIFQHPDNPWYPAKWFTRDYGFFSPTPMYWPPNDSHMELPMGKTLTLRYRVVVFTGDVSAAELENWFSPYAASK